MADKDVKKYECPYCGETFDSFEDLKKDILVNHKGKNLPVLDGRIRLNINDCEHILHVEPNETLYEIIHNRLGLTGSKQFCDRGACGSCTVIMNGLPVLSCMILAIECDGSKIETVEGIAASGHPLIESYVEHHAMQCGYCTPGFVVTAKSLLDKNPTPTVQDIKNALAGNLCRCSTYPQHPLAILDSVKKLQADKKVKGV